MRDSIILELHEVYRLKKDLGGILIFYDAKYSFYAKYVSLDKNNNIYGGDDLEEVYKAALE